MELQEFEPWKKFSVWRFRMEQKSCKKWICIETLPVSSEEKFTFSTLNKSFFYQNPPTDWLETWMVHHLEASMSTPYQLQLSWFRDFPISHQSRKIR